MGRDHAGIRAGVAAAAAGGGRRVNRTRSPMQYPRQSKRSIDENADALQCLSYINGFVAGASIVGGPRPFCIPTTATLVQEADAYLAWAGKHADMLMQPTYVTLQRPCAEAFP